MLYDTIAASNGFYAQPVDPAVRSLMNVPFTIPSNPDLEKTFVSEAAKLGMVCTNAPYARVSHQSQIQLKGHRSVGGMRASIYNAMPLEGVEALAEFMKAFQASHS